MDKGLEDNILVLKDILKDDLAIPPMPKDKEETASPLKAQTNDNEDQDTQIWAYMGACGGVGVTSLAIQTAYALANATEQNNKVCLVDLDFERSSVAACLDMVPSVLISDLNAANGRMDESLCMHFVQNYNNLFSVVCAKGELGGNDRIEAGALMALLDHLCSLYDYIILDVPQMWRPWSKAVIGVVDKFAIVSEMRVPTLHYTRTLSEAICESLTLEQHPDIIISKYERRNFRNSLFIQDAEKVIGCENIGEICVDNETLQEALNCGMPAGKIKPNSRYVAAVNKHVDSWLGVELVEDTSSHSKWRKRVRSA